MNNNHFALARYLRELEYDADLLLTNAEHDHFHPKCDTYDLSYADFTKQLKWGSRRKFIKVPKSQIIKDIAPYDITIGTGLIPAFFARAGYTLDIFIPYGSDIFNDTKYKPMKSLKSRPIDRIFSVIFQRKGIKKVQVIHACKMIPEYEKVLTNLANHAQRWFEPVPMVYAPEYEGDENNFDGHWKQQFQKIRRENSIMIVFAARNVFTSSNDPSTKGIDIFLKGLKLFCDNNKDTKIKAVLFEYGKDVSESKALAKRLNLVSSTQWLPKMNRKDLMIGLKMADICCGQFGISWAQNGTILETLVAGKPLLTWLDNKQYDTKSLYPHYNANSPTEIQFQLEKFVKDIDTGKKMGFAARQWYDENVVSKSINRYSDYIKRVESTRLQRL